MVPALRCLPRPALRSNIFTVCLDSMEDSERQRENPIPITLMHYKVTWEIDVEADNPVEAAELALSVQRNPESIANVFIVRGQKVAGCTHGIPVHVDLQAVCEQRAAVNGHGHGKPQGRWGGN